MEMDLTLIESQGVCRVTKEQLIPAYKALLDNGLQLRTARQTRAQKLGEALAAQAATTKTNNTVLNDVAAGRLTVGEAERKLALANDKERRARAQLREHDILQDAKRFRREQASTFTSYLRGELQELIDEALQEKNDRRL